MEGEGGDMDGAAGWYVCGWVGWARGGGTWTGRVVDKSMATGSTGSTGQSIQCAALHLASPS